MSYALIHTSGSVELDLGTFARATGTHPDLVCRLVTLGILDARQDPSGDLRFATSQLARLARVQRLRAGLALNYAAVGLVIDLLDRIAILEAALRVAPGGDPREPHEAASPGGRPPGTPRPASPGGQPPGTPRAASPGGRPPGTPRGANPGARPGNFPGG
jgi:chaperone modulatory protein CbpM